MTSSYFATEGNAKGIVLVAHGLNTKPSVMNEIIDLLSMNGYHCARISLYSPDIDNHSTPERIAEAWESSYKEAFDRSKELWPNLSTFAVGYSLGALVTLRVLSQTGSTPIEKMVLIAPPVRLTRIARLVRYFLPLGRFGLILPSAAPRSVRARWGTPVAEFGALLKLIDGVQDLTANLAFNDLPTLVLTSKKDELVSNPGLRSWIKDNELDKWSMVQIKKDPPSRRSYAHLMVTQNSLGPKNWSTLTRLTLDHFK